MQTNKELKVAIIVGVIMVTICILAFIYVKSERTANTNNLNQIDIKVYKVNEEEKSYVPCHITTDNLIQINSEFNKAYRLKETSRVVGKSITGTYRVQSGEKWVAFDLNEKEQYIYRGDTKYLYEFKSELYDIVSKACN
jgi:hypothetical protein